MILKRTEKRYLYFLNFNSYGVNRICIFTRETTKLGLFRICFVYTNKQSKAVYGTVGHIFDYSTKQA